MDHTKKTARTAGFLYLVVLITANVGLFYSRDVLVVGWLATSGRQARNWRARLDSNQVSVWVFYDATTGGD